MQTCLCHFSFSRRNLSDSFFLIIEMQPRQQTKKKPLKFVINNFLLLLLAPSLDKTISCFPCFTGFLSLSRCPALVLHKHMTVVFCLLLNGILNIFLCLVVGLSIVECNARAGIVDKTSRDFSYDHEECLRPEDYSCTNSSVIVNSTLVEFFETILQEASRNEKQKQTVSKQVI